MTPAEFYLIYEARLPPQEDESRNPNRTLSDEQYEHLNSLLDD